VHVSTTVALVVAIAGVAVAAIALALAWWSSVKVRRLRDAQRTLVGGGRKDLVDFAVSLQARIDDLHRAVDEIAAGLARVDRRVDGVVSNTSIVRYDAYEDTGGHQSASLALLDSARTGIVVTAIQGRDYARIYMKELERGRASVALSPEEQDAVDRAMGRGA
jgi:HAMP domain-containing protein